MARELINATSEFHSLRRGLCWLRVISVALFLSQTAVACGGQSNGPSGHRDAPPLDSRPRAVSRQPDGAVVHPAARSSEPCDEKWLQLSMAQRDAAATWVGFARWQPKGTRITLVFQGTPPSTLVRLAHDGCASKPRPGQPVIVFGRRGQLPLATPMIKAGLVELAHFMKAGRPGVAPATSAAIHYALQRALPRYLRGRSVSVRFAKLAGTRQRLSGVRLRFVATAARRGVTICTATSRGPLHYIAGFTPEGDARGRPLDRYQGFQVVFLSDKVAKPGATASSKLLAVIRPKSYLHGHCP